ncbi:outer membrane beta-barrel protein [Vibrio brasiliensis]
MKNMILLASMLSVPVLATDESPRFFIGLKGGYQWALDDTYNQSNPEGTIVGVYGGLQFTPSWSWDVGYQHHEKLKATATSVDVKTWLIESALRYDWYLQDNLSLYGRLGVAYWDMEKTINLSDKLEASGFSPLGEVGVHYHFNSNVSLSAGYQYIDSIGKLNTGRYDSQGMIFGLMYTFDVTSQPALVGDTSTSMIEETPVKETSTVNPPPQTLVFSSKSTSGLFDLDSIKHSNDFIDQLAEVAAVLKTYPNAKAVVVGHTDSTGSASYNQKLSEYRAQTSVSKLIELGVAPTQLEWQGEGESRPIADNNTEDGRAKNRRVEITITNFKI